ncbi:putative quinol monooxygenase [Paenibacillus pinistramenti]|uniref:putative quinol monooxygenase n=1 Tax=Paenibacillus pinistramenti TaxID=1768003 RepID=UPI001107D31A|nr:antibiotic biosynthesis monooxygenase [Paenibacillus pinistramenti]
MEKFGLYTKFTAREGQRDTLAEILLAAADSMEFVKECVHYIINVPDGDQNAVWVTEIWNDRAAHQSSLSLESAKELIQKAKPLITGVEQITLNPVGGKGL